MIWYLKKLKNKEIVFIRVIHTVVHNIFLHSIYFYLTHILTFYLHSIWHSLLTNILTF